MEGTIKIGAVLTGAVKGGILQLGLPDTHGAPLVEEIRSRKKLWLNWKRACAFPKRKTIHRCGAYTRNMRGLGQILNWQTKYASLKGRILHVRVADICRPIPVKALHSHLREDLLT